MDKVETLMSTKSFEYHFDNSDQCFFGVFLVAPLFNNCCSPTTNVEKFALLNYDDFQIIQTKRFIKKGEELMTSYNVGLTPYEIRQKSFSDWGFICECEYCLYEKENHFLKKIIDCETRIRNQIVKKNRDETLGLMQDLNEIMLSIDKRFFHSKGMAGKMISLIFQFDEAFGKNEKMNEIQKRFWDIWLSTKDYGSYFYTNLKYYLISIASNGQEKEKYEKALIIAEKNCSTFVKNLIDETMVYYKI